MTLTIMFSTITPAGDFFQNEDLATVRAAVTFGPLSTGAEVYHESGAIGLPAEGDLDAVIVINRKGALETVRCAIPGAEQGARCPAVDAAADELQRGIEGAEPEENAAGSPCFLTFLSAAVQAWRGNAAKITVKRNSQTGSALSSGKSRIVGANGRNEDVLVVAPENRAPALAQASRRHLDGGLPGSRAGSRKRTRRRSKRT